MAEGNEFEPCIRFSRAEYLQQIKLSRYRWFRKANLKPSGQNRTESSNSLPSANKSQLQRNSETLGVKYSEKARFARGNSCNLVLISVDMPGLRFA